MNLKRVLQRLMLENLKCMSQKVILKPLKVKKTTETRCSCRIEKQNQGYFAPKLDELGLLDL